MSVNAAGYYVTVKTLGECPQEAVSPELSGLTGFRSFTMALDDLYDAKIKAVVTLDWHGIVIAQADCESVDGKWRIYGRFPCEFTKVSG